MAQLLRRKIPTHVCIGPIADSCSEPWKSQDSVVAKTNEPFTQILPAVQFVDCTWAILNAFRDFFAESQPTLADPFGEPGYRFFVTMLVVKNQKSGNSRPLNKNVALNPRTDWRSIPARGRSWTANDDPGPRCTLRQPRIADRAGRIIEIDVNATWARFAQCGGKASTF